MEIRDLIIGKEYIKTSAYSGRTWFRVKCVYKTEERAEFIILSPIPDNQQTRACGGFGRKEEYNRLECERYIQKANDENYTTTNTVVSDDVINRKCRTKHDELILLRKNHVEGKGQLVGMPMSSHEISAHIDGFEQGAKWMRSQMEEKMADFAEWCGTHCVKCRGGWWHRYAEETTENIVTTQRLLEIWAKSR